MIQVSYDTSLSLLSLNFQVTVFVSPRQQLTTLFFRHCLRWQNLGVVFV
jgi:hypothetical protein